MNHMPEEFYTLRGKKLEGSLREVINMTKKKEGKEEKKVYWKLGAKNGHGERWNQLFISKLTENTKVLKDHLTCRTVSRG